MKLETRFALLFSVLGAGFLGALLMLHLAQQKSATELQQEIATAKTRQLAYAIEVDGRTLERFVADYTQWDDMCAFVASRDPAWAEINIAQSLQSWNFHGAWVLALDRSEIYRRVEHPLSPQDLDGFPGEGVRAHLCDANRHRFFVGTPGGLLEIRSAPIRPSDDSHQEDPPQGWFLVAKLWTTATLEQLGSITESTISLQPASQLPAPPSDNTTVRATLPVNDWAGTPVQFIALEHTSSLLANMEAYDSDEVILFLTFGICVIGAVAWFLNRWVQRPVNLIESSLADDRPDRVVPLERNRDEFARIAVLIRTAAVQRLSLRREIEDRTFAEHELRRASVERAELGRDLHDGVIQSIYAVGMTLQGINPLIDRDAGEARRRLGSCVDGLNRTIGQLRNHIAGLEKEIGGEPSLAEGLHKLIQETKSARDVEYDVKVDPLLDRAIPQDSVVQLLFIAREAVSNALRHGHASHVSLRLDTVQSEAVFTIEDDGGGFATAHAQRGHGLDNMTRRAEEIGASLTIESIVGRGTRLRVELPWSMLGEENSTLPAINP